MQDQDWFTVRVGNQLDRKVKFVRDIESAISPWVQYKVPPPDRIGECQKSHGYIHIYFMRFVMQDGSFLECMRVFGSSNVVQFLSSTTDKLMTLPFMTRSPIVNTAVYEVTNCWHALLQINTLTWAFFIGSPGYLFIHEQYGEKYFKTARDEDQVQFQQSIKSAIRSYLVEPAVH